GHRQGCNDRPVLRSADEGTGLEGNDGHVWFDPCEIRRRRDGGWLSPLDRPGVLMRQTRHSRQDRDHVRRVPANRDRTGGDSLVRYLREHDQTHEMNRFRLIDDLACDAVTGSLGGYGSWRDGRGPVRQEEGRNLNKGR